MHTRQRIQIGAIVGLYGGGLIIGVGLILRLMLMRMGLIPTPSSNSAKVIAITTGNAKATSSAGMTMENTKTSLVVKG